MFNNKKFKTYEEHLSNWISVVGNLTDRVQNLERQVFKFKYPAKFKEQDIVGEYKILYADVIMENYNYYNIYDVLNLNTGKRLEFKECQLIDHKESFDFREKRFNPSG